MSHNKGLKNIEGMFDVSAGDMKRIISDFHAEMKEALCGRKSSLAMLPAHVGRPKGTEKGSFLALDLGGTNFRVLSLELRGHRKIRTSLSKKFALKKKHITGTGRELFDFIAGRIRSFMQDCGMDTAGRHNVGFTFSFPMKKKGAASGVLLGWTKGFKAGGVVGKDVVKLLNESLARNGLRNTKVVALANDTVSTLAARSYEDPDCDVGVILGTGTNACYVEALSNIPNWKGGETPSGETVINMEWGNFNKLKPASYDKKLDNSSGNPGRQILEKMVSGMYLGALARLVAKDLMPKMNLPKDFKTENMSAVESDTTKNLSGIKALLKRLGVADSTFEERALLKKICGVISTRAARVSAAAMAAVVAKMDPGLSRRHTIAVDGSVYEKYPGFSSKVRKAFRELFKRKAETITIRLTKDASAKGAAIIAAAVRNLP